MLLIVSLSSIYGQKALDKRYYNWYFGNLVAITFKTDIPSALMNSQMYAYEGCASISDTAGNLLFYANGGAVWDSTHQVMLNGDNLKSGTIGSSGGSGSQSTLIVPWPENDTLYYLFTTMDLGASPGAIYYSIINMSGNNGLGEISSDKNILLKDSVGEKTTMAKHCNGKNYWIIAHGRNNNTFYAWHLSNTGIIDTVISETGGLYSSCAGDGYMKVSPNSKKIAAAVNHDCIIGDSGFIELYDFDNATGIVSSPMHILDIVNPYGLEFSPDHSKLFVGASDKLYQYDLLNASGDELTKEQIKSSEYIKKLSGTHSAFQLGPDNKIYVAKAFSNSLGVIDDPKVGIDSYIENGLNLGTGQCRLGLPNYTAQRYIQSGFILSDTTACINENIFFTAVTDNFPESQIWYFGDGDSSTLNNPQHVYKTAGLYLVQLIVFSYCEAADTFIRTINVSESIPVNAYTDTSIISGDTVRLNVAGSGESIQWSPANSLSCSDCINPLAFPKETTTYYVTITNNKGCSGTDSVSVSVKNECNIFVANSFSPDNDGKNDYLRIYNFEDSEIKIYDRFGNKVFESNNSNIHYWDGKIRGENMPGNYVYIINSLECGIVRGNISIIY